MDLNQIHQSDSDPESGSMQRLQASCPPSKYPPLRKTCLVDLSQPPPQPEGNGKSRILSVHLPTTMRRSVASSGVSCNSLRKVESRMNASLVRSLRSSLKGCRIPTGSQSKCDKR